MLVACQPKPADPPTQPADQPVVEPDEGKPVTATQVTLSPLEQKEVEVTVGTTLLYSYKSHASVGLGAMQEVADPAVVEYVRTDMKYEQSEADRRGKTGADAATGTFVFEAVAAGTTTVKVEEWMRGDVLQSSTFTITVTDP